jgi:RNA polymerase sigma-70 factor (ECF subfamily)
VSSRPFGPFSDAHPPLAAHQDRDPHQTAATEPSEIGMTVALARSTLDLAFRQESPSLLSYFGRRVGHEAAPDMLQEVFTRAAGSPQAGKLNNPAAFLRRVARNLLIDRSRRRKADNVILFPLDEQRHAASMPEQEHGLLARDLMRLYDQAVDALPVKTRRVFLMHRVDELSYRAIHERLGISVATVEYHMMKALAHIARAVDAAR